MTEDDAPVVVSESPSLSALDVADDAARRSRCLWARYRGDRPRGRSGGRRLRRPESWSRRATLNCVTVLASTGDSGVSPRSTRPVGWSSGWHGRRREPRRTALVRQRGHTADRPRW